MSRPTNFPMQNGRPTVDPQCRPPRHQVPATILPLLDELDDLGLRIEAARREESRLLEPERDSEAHEADVAAVEAAVRTGRGDATVRPAADKLAKDRADATHALSALLHAKDRVSDDVSDARVLEAANPKYQALADRARKKWEDALTAADKAYSELIAVEKLPAWLDGSNFQVLTDVDGDDLLPHLSPRGLRVNEVSLPVAGVLEGLRQATRT